MAAPFRQNRRRNPTRDGEGPESATKNPKSNCLNEVNEIAKYVT